MYPAEIAEAICCICAGSIPPKELGACCACMAAIAGPIMAIMLAQLCAPAAAAGGSEAEAGKLMLLDQEHQRSSDGVQDKCTGAEDPDRGVLELKRKLAQAMAERDAAMALAEQE